MCAPSVGCILMISNSSCGERPVLLQHPVGDADLADVVQQRAEAEDVELPLVEPQLPPDDDRQRADALGVAGGVGVARVERGGQRLDRADVGELGLRFGRLRATSPSG